MTNKTKKRDKDYYKELYSSKRRLKARVLWQERRLAEAVALYLKLPNAFPIRSSNLYTRLEWLLTWKLKTGCCPQVMWCDGLANLAIKKVGKYQIVFKSNIWIGPEDGSSITTKGRIKGTIEVRPTTKQLKSYKMVISHDGEQYIAKRT